MKTSAVSFAMFVAGALASPINMNMARAEQQQQVEVPAAVKIQLRHTEFAARRDGRDTNFDRHGHMTYYEVGLGACGHDDSGKGDIDNIVAVSSALMNGHGAGDACDRKIAIKGHGGKEVTAVVRDKCPSCPPGGIDVSPKVFRELAGNLDVGKTEVSWTFI
ncbi:RlpA-like double-psi beta-barrel-protein domain-containing protein-containing protein [Apiosordaria backusii]|uniref:RlpA-like double-psi beta-barrel-protein domain-containing protein-containing protein n=1 Tax=Apiosordaria backusii TaxID=314023 RepID=A0AA40ANH2_9PEZI|nr:RlpA-like double-psi beta-barrel-protein domain-containing protein-containing protein [Apiosordaria backusii]